MQRTCPRRVARFGWPISRSRVASRLEARAGLVPASVFKTDVTSRERRLGGFDSHALPPIPAPRDSDFILDERGRVNAPVIWLLMAGARVLHWNGKDIPEELRELPAGTYVVEAIENAPTLTPDEDRGLAEALASLRAGESRTLDQVRQTIDSIVRR